MDIKVPLNRLRFGHDDGAGINARVSGRLADIPALAANMYARGQIENLVVKRFGDDPGLPVPDGWTGTRDLFSVSNGNRRLAAWHRIHGENGTQPIDCTLRDVDEDGAFEDSLATAVTAKQLHPVDQYEGFTRLAERGKTNEEIALQYGMTEREVEQALALGHLSPKIRNAWRKGEIKTDMAQAFTLARDHKTQDKLFAKLAKAGHLYSHLVRRELGADANGDVGAMLEFVGAEEYRGRGGEVIEDLFQSGHIVSNGALLQTMVAEKLDAKCEQLRGDGWGWVALASELPEAARYWQQAAPKKLIFIDDEEARLKKLEKEAAEAERANDGGNTDETAEARSQQLDIEIGALKLAVRSRSFTEKQKALLGCVVGLEDGAETLRVGVQRPAEVAASPAKAPARGASSKQKDKAADEPAISQALLHRMSLQLTEAAATALQQDVELSLIVLLAGIQARHDGNVNVRIGGVGAAKLDVTGAVEVADNIAVLRKMKLQDRMALVAPIAAAALDFQNCSLDQNVGDRFNTLHAVCNALDPKAFNAALRGAFDAKDYFEGVSKPLCIAAIREAGFTEDQAKTSAKSKGEIAAFAIANVPQTGWLPPQLRAKAYGGPPVAKGKPAAAKPADPKRAPAKRAAAAKAPSKKPTAKKAKAKKRKS